LSLHDALPISASKFHRSPVAGRTRPGRGHPGRPQHAVYLARCRGTVTNCRSRSRALQSPARSPEAAMTEELFREDSYVRECEASVIAAAPDGSVLDR